MTMRFQIQIHRIAETAAEMSILLNVYTMLDLTLAEAKFQNVHLESDQCAELIGPRGEVIAVKYA